MDFERFVVIDTPDCLWTFEDQYGMTVAHCTIRVPWTPSVRRRVLTAWNLAASLWPASIYAICNDDAKHVKFFKLCGFEPLGPSECTDGKVRTVYVKRYAT